MSSPVLSAVSYLLLLIIFGIRRDAMKKIVQFGHWAEKNWLALVIMLSVIMMSFLCLILCSWLYGYWSNALNGTKFELMSCWSGVSAVAGGLAGIVGLAKAAWTKYGMDSRFNSAPGTMPLSKEVKNDARNRT